MYKRQALRLDQPAEKKFHGFDRRERAQNFSQHPHTVQFIGRQQQLVFSRARAIDVNCRENALIHEPAIEIDFHVAGALELFDPRERLNRIADILEVEIEKLNVDRTINTRVKRQMERAQKEYYLNEKLKAIQKELGRGEASEIDQLKKKIETSGMPAEVQEKAVQELKRLEMMPPMSRCV